MTRQRRESRSGNTRRCFSGREPSRAETFFRGVEGRGKKEAAGVRRTRKEAGSAGRSRDFGTHSWGDKGGGNRSFAPRRTSAPHERSTPEAAHEIGARAAERGLLFGRNPIQEALRAGQSIDKLWFLRRDERGQDARLSALVRECKEAGAVLIELDRKSLDRLSGGEPHQGIVAQVPAAEYADFGELLEKLSDKDDAFFILPDRLQDPHNLGAVLRVADTAGADAVLIPKHEAAGLTPTVAKSSAGALAHVPVCRVANPAQVADRLKEEGFWIIAADMDGEALYTSKTLNQLIKGKILLLVGNEGKGLAAKLRERADLVLSIPMKGKINSLNASVSTAIVAYEILRRREAAVAEQLHTKADAT